MNLDEFNKMMERSVRAQLRAGRKVVSSYWGTLNKEGNDIACGCPLTLMVREQFGVEKALELVENDEDGDSNDLLIARWFGLQSHSVRNFRIGFDDVNRLDDNDWLETGKRAQLCFQAKLEPTSLTKLMMQDEGEKFLQLVLSNQKWIDKSTSLGAQAIAFLLRKGKFDRALDSRRHHRDNIAKSSSTLDKWLTDFFGE